MEIILRLGVHIRIAGGLVKALTTRLGIHPIILHTPYLLNLASPDDDIWGKSKGALADAVERAPLLRADFIVAHIGSHKGSGYEGGVVRISEAVRFALDADPHATIALELGSGAGRSIGSRFEHIADIISCLPDVIDRVGICIDTAHLWGSGFNCINKPVIIGRHCTIFKHVQSGRLYATGRKWIALCVLLRNLSPVWPVSINCHVRSCPRSP